MLNSKLKVLLNNLGYGISSSYSPSLTSSGLREASSLSGLHSSNGTIGSDVIAPSAAVTSLSSLKGKYLYKQNKVCVCRTHIYNM